jgi:4-hydroxy-tetrahydrodipicolinate synthase
MFNGVYTAIVTPFKDGELDEDSLRNLIEYQLESRVDGLVPCGTTGEAPTLSAEEYRRVVKITVEAVKGQVPVVAGAGSNSTAKAVQLSELVRELGADGTLQAAPYYNKPTQEGIFRHFEKLAAVGLPMMLYNIPGRCGVNIEPGTMARLAGLPQVAALKEASGDLNQMMQISRTCCPGISLLSGDDALTLPLLSIGGQGVVSVLSNLMPQQVIEVYQAWRHGEQQKAWQLHAALQPITKAMFMEPNPAPVKAALAKKAIIAADQIRLPMCELSREGRTALDRVMAETGLL